MVSDLSTLLLYTKPPKLTNVNKVKFVFDLRRRCLWSVGKFRRFELLAGSFVILVAEVHLKFVAYLARARDRLFATVSILDVTTLFFNQGLFAVPANRSVDPFVDGVHEDHSCRVVASEFLN